MYAPVYDNQGNVVDIEKCSFCRTPWHSSDAESLKMLKKRVDMNDSDAIYSLGCLYRDGRLGTPQNSAKAVEFWHRAAELGSADAYYNIGIVYNTGYGGMGVDDNKAVHYYEVAAMEGHAEARHNLAVGEMHKGNLTRALRHFMIAVKDGDSKSLENIKNMCKYRLATKDTYAKALQLHQTYVDEIKTAQRDEAAAMGEEYKYY